MRAQITIDSAGRVTLTADNPVTGERTARTYCCPRDGGYVVELLADGSSRQVCDGLARLGSTLRASSRDVLPAVIRREWSHARRQWAREDRRLAY